MHPKPVGGVATDVVFLRGDDVASDGFGGAAFAVFAQWNFFTEFQFPSAKAGAKTGGWKQSASITLCHHGWGGTDGGFAAEHWQPQANAADAISAATTVFRLIGMGQTASSPEEARPLRFLLERDCSSMNRDHLLVAARDRALAMALDYVPPRAPGFAATGGAGAEKLSAVIERLQKKGIMTPHDHTVGAQLVQVLCGGDRAAGEPVAEDDVLALEREAFLYLAGTPATIARIDYMREHGRPLRN